MNKPDYLTDNDWRLLKEKYDNLDEVVKRLNNNYPVQYLIGNVNFYGYDIFVDENVLIPRFETEGLLELTMEYLHKYNLESTNVLEIGTGSGCIPVVLKKELPSLNITSIDISLDALKVAKKNFDLNKVKINLINESIYDYKVNESYGLIISNPPYVAIDEVVDPKTNYEPQIALYAKDSGMEIIKYIISHAKDYLKEKSILAFEIGYLQGDALKKYAKDFFNDALIFVKKDLSGRDRYLFIINE